MTDQQNDIITDGQKGRMTVSNEKMLKGILLKMRQK